VLKISEPLFILLDRYSEIHVGMQDERTSSHVANILQSPACPGSSAAAATHGCTTRERSVESRRLGAQSETRTEMCNLVAQASSI
jgi:hypothetical protein